eukprot:CAMPEP_0117424138 /NCGR_PEP_ID=MMETSP0758-20121206/4616_1 /TAXON_ID=63605 /ORGANISM="Percolomonas cosmopolitus, Strain AE-1 (ATCC 50343)" /LENGTH=691 /DNA_ID=CAMNT_0005207735 /DNA_START=299 /DNA_END=2374 /DNA_ORIENTATION=-
MRNIGISAHIDSGKTTLTERILFYTGRIAAIHEVKGSDEVGAFMDSMELERERGITIQSAATHCEWKETKLNIIDTPGHVDFTVEVERALRVLDGGILILCAIGGVQSQSLTVDRQMKRYKVPRICFINKLDRVGADPFAVIKQIRSKLGLNAAAVQIPIGLENQLEGVVDLIHQKAYRFDGNSGETLTEIDIPERLMDEVETRRNEFLEKLADADAAIEEKYIMEEDIEPEEIEEAIRRCTLSHSFVPVFMGSAKANIGVQPLLDGVEKYLPHPGEVDNYGLLTSNDGKSEEKTLIISDPKDNFVGLAFKLEESQYGQLTYIRIYQGTIKTGQNLFNTRTGQKIRVSRLGRMHSNKMEDVKSVGPGEICVIFGVECSSGDTFVNVNKWKLGMESMFVPEPVVSLSIKNTDKKKDTAFSKALARFQREDPTFTVTQDDESGETAIHGMGELHLEVYAERMQREYDCPVEIGKPYVAYRETLNKRVDFKYLHRKQTGGAGQFAGVSGYIEPLDIEGEVKYEFENAIVGNAIDPNYISAVDKGFQEAVDKGPLIGCPVWGVRVVINDGQTHPVDSSEMAFKAAAKGAFREAFADSNPTLVEPIMDVEVSFPQEYQSAVMANIAKKRGSIYKTSNAGEYMTAHSEIPLKEMFGYISELRSLTQGKGEYSMNYLCHRHAPNDITKQVVREHEQKK